MDFGELKFVSARHSVAFAAEFRPVVPSPFAMRKKKRAMIPELRRWNAYASIGKRW